MICGTVYTFVIVTDFSCCEGMDVISVGPYKASTVGTPTSKSSLLDHPDTDTVLGYTEFSCCSTSDDGG